jgi:hypothetical protein
MSALAKTDADRPQDQRAGMCYTAWRSKESQDTYHPSFLRILSLFLKRYGEEIGRQKFDFFVRRNGLNTGRAYDPRAQFTEAFSWAEPFIRFMKADKEAKWYAIRAIHAIVSLNDNDYTDLDKMQKAAISMNYRPLNYNHDHNRWLPYPRTRVEYAHAEDMCVELIIRVANEEEYLQKQLDHDPSIPEEEWINHPSIEGRPLVGGREAGYHFTALALLEKGYQLPGDPLSEIFPIMLEGIQGGQVCLLVDGEEVCLECESTIQESTPRIISKEGNRISENIGEINQGGAECPNCGHVVNLDGINMPSEVDCPNCGTSMKARPEKTVETVDNLNNTEEDSSTMANTSEETTLDKNASAISNAEKALEEAEEMSKSELKVQIASLNAELAYKNADLTEVTTELREVKRDRINEANEFRKEIQDLSTKLASKTREVATLEFLRNKITEMTEEAAIHENTIKELNDKTAELQNIIASKESRIDAIKRELAGLKADYEKIKLQFEDTRKDRNKLSVEARAAEEKALNETRERSRIELDNADLLEKQKDLTAEISRLTERISLSAAQKLEQEKEMGKLLEQNRKLREAHEAKIADLQKTIEEAKKFHSWAWGKLKEAGYAVVE